MRAGRNGSPDETRERYLGEIAPLLAAAKNVESLSVLQKKQLRRRIVRTLFRTRSLHLRARLTPVLVGIGLLIAGGVAFATAQRLGLIRRTEPAVLQSAEKVASAGTNRRRGSRASEAPRRGMEDAEAALAGEASVGREVLPELPDPLLIATGPASSSVWALMEEDENPMVATSEPRASATVVPLEASTATPSAQAAVARSSTAHAARLTTRAGGRAVAPAPSARFASAASRPVSGKLALATPYLAEPPGSPLAGMPPASSADAMRFVPSAQAASAPVERPGVPAGAPLPAPTPSQAAPEPASPPSARQQAADSPVLPAAPRRTPAGDSTLFAQALRKLRHESEPALALVILQQHEQAYPRSALAGERTELEVEALLALHRDREALQKLDGMPLGRLPRSGERFVVRGELRAAARRWQEARADFDMALSQVSGSPSWYERALWGRGVARLRCGEQATGLADVERYIDLYPKGRFAAEARRFFPDR